MQCPFVITAKGKVETNLKHIIRKKAARVVVIANAIEQLKAGKYY